MDQAESDGDLMILYDIATARAGDKGNTAQIAVIAKDSSSYQFLAKKLTPDRVAAHFRDLAPGSISRHDVPALNAFVFLIEGALGGGVSIALASDPHGKSLSSLMLTLRLDTDV
jgi:hypothetical protein